MRTHAFRRQDIRCSLFGHDWRLGVPQPVTGSRFWDCPRCNRTAGVERQHVRTPSRWMFTFWRDEAQSLIDIYSNKPILISPAVMNALSRASVGLFNPGTDPATLKPVLIDRQAAAEAFDRALKDPRTEIFID